MIHFSDSSCTFQLYHPIASIYDVWFLYTYYTITISQMWATMPFSMEAMGIYGICLQYTPPKFNMEPENEPLEEEIPMQNHHF